MYLVDKSFDILPAEIASMCCFGCRSRYYYVTFQMINIDPWIISGKPKGICARLLKYLWLLMIFTVS